MAELVVEGEELVVRLRAVEKAEGVHGDIRVPMKSVRSVEVLDDAYHAVHGLRSGLRVPGMTAVGIFWLPGKKMFAAVHRDTPRGVRVLLSGADFDQLIVGCDDPDSTAAALGGKLH